MNNQPWNSIWKNKDKTEFEVYKTNMPSITLKKGSWVKIPGIDDNYKCIVDNLFHSKKNDNDKDNDKDNNNDNDNDNDKGPIGITYLPWIENECKFADVSWSIKGNRRFIVCYPEGMSNYGRHIDWDNVELCEPPNNVSKEQIQSVLEIEY